MCTNLKACFSNVHCGFGFRGDGDSRGVCDLLFCARSYRMESYNHLSICLLKSQFWDKNLKVHSVVHFEVEGTKFSENTWRDACTLSNYTVRRSERAFVKTSHAPYYPFSPSPEKISRHLLPAFLFPPPFYHVLSSLRLFSSVLVSFTQPFSLPGKDLSPRK